MGVCAGEVLHLYQTTRPAPGTVGTVELEQATDTTIIRDAGFQRVIFFGAGLAEFLSDFEHPLHIGGLRLFQHRGDGFFGDAGNFCVAIRGLGQPSGKLLDGVGIVQPGELAGLSHQLAFDRSADDESAAHHFHVSGHAPRVHRQVGFPLLLHKRGHGKRRQAAVNFHFGYNVLPVVLLEQFPFGGVVLG